MSQASIWQPPSVKDWTGNSVGLESELYSSTSTNAATTGERRESRGYTVIKLAKIGTRTRLSVWTAVCQTRPHSGSYKDGGLLGPLEASPTQFQRLWPPQMLAPCILLPMGVGREEPVRTGSDTASCLFPRALPGCHQQKSQLPVISIKDSQVAKITIVSTH